MNAGYRGPGSHGWAENAPATERLQEAAAAGIALAEAWERFWTAVRALETANGSVAMSDHCKAIGASMNLVTLSPDRNPIPAVSADDPLVNSVTAYTARMRAEAARCTTWPTSTRLSRTTASRFRWSSMAPAAAETAGMTEALSDDDYIRLGRILEQDGVTYWRAGTDTRPYDKDQEGGMTIDMSIPISLEEAALLDRVGEPW